MPTTRPRHFVTETDELAAALDAAAARWPGLSRSKLLVRLALDGHRGGEQADRSRREGRLTALRDNAGASTGVYGPGHLAHLRDEWPE